MQFALEGGQQTPANNEMIDAMVDYYLTKDKVHRFRFGLQRVPNAFDTYRSSTNRQEMDRHESIQSGAPGERDLGVAYYWSPKVAQERFSVSRVPQRTRRLRCLRSHGLQRTRQEPVGVEQG